MTKKKAIEAAVAKGWDAGVASASVRNGCIISAECAYDLGRIAGLREAARLVQCSDYDRQVILSKANAPKKKARAK